MGVPKFYRWLSERYPCLSQVVKDYQIPEFDNFYLDMNGIIHNCSHPNDDDPSFRISEEKIFTDIFHYLEVLFRIIKPQKLLFMAIDGVAPRAKMNQQRGRRFRSAKDAEDLMRKAVAKGVHLPEEARFDSNCITPGTEFMARLQEQLKYFINKKVSTDPAWQKIEVVLSGHQVPGEGEHKIMECIRWMKAQENYDPNTRHCLYGLDADLIILGMITHEPHFSLLREEVIFGKKVKRQTTPDTITFHLLHLSILREYLDFEFSALKEVLPFGYDLERIIDDWVLMGFLVGNDFIPHLPNMHIRQDVLPFLFQKYTGVLPTLGGYINENGVLNMERFERYLEAVAEFDYDHFSELLSDAKWMAAKSSVRGHNESGWRQKNGNGKVRQEVENGSKEDIDDSDVSLMDFSQSFNNAENTSDSQVEEKLKRDLGISDLEKYFADEDEDRVDNFEEEMTSYKARYYREKMGYQIVDPTVLHEQAKCYVVAIQWILHYYYTGVASWSWFYPYHYAPYVSDIKDIGQLVITFDLGEPFLPFEQLMAVLPSASRFLLPACFQGLMVNEDSPIRDFYPNVFSTDLNGKQHEWEAVVLVPFIDEERLIEAMRQHSPLLTKEEVQRNCHGPCFSYQYQKLAPSVNYPSPWPQKFPVIENCKAVCKVLSTDAYAIPKEKMVFGLCSGVKSEVFFPGFPTLKHIPHKAYLEQHSVRVFQSVSRGMSMCLEVLPRIDQDKPTADIAKELVGKTCYVGWPYLMEARVWAVVDSKESWYKNSTGHNQGQPRLMKDKLNDAQLKQWKEDVTRISREYSQRHGIIIGEVRVLVYAQDLQGKRFILDKSGPRGTLCLDKQWSLLPMPYPLQTTVLDISSHAPEFKDSIKTMDELYSEGDQCFLLNPQHYGEQAEIVSVDMRIQRVTVKLCIQQEPDLNPLIAKYHHLSVHYQPLFQIASRLKLPQVLVSRITASLQCERGSRENVKERERFNLGLNWKFSQRNQEILGYARRTERGWSFSPAAENLLSKYMESFPKMFNYLVNHPEQDRYYEDELFPEKESKETMVAAKEWLKSLPTQDMVAVDCGSDTVDEVHIRELEKAVANMKAHPKPNKPMKMKIKPGFLFKLMDQQRGLLPDEYADYFLLDRVVNVGSNSCVPFGLRGTVTGILGDGNHTLYEVVFDEEFLGGLVLRCSGSKAYRLPPHCLINLSHGQRVTKMRYQPRNSQSPSVQRDLNYSSALQSAYSPESRSTAQQSSRGSDREHYERKYNPRSMEHSGDMYGLRSSFTRQQKTQNPSKRKQGQSEGGSSDTLHIKAIVHREQAKGTSSSSSAANEFTSMMEAYQDQTDNIMVHPLDVQRNNAGVKTQSFKNAVPTKSSKVIRSDSKPVTTTASKSVLGKKDGDLSGSEAKVSLDQIPKVKSIPPASSASVNAPLAAAIQALSKLDISTLPTKSAGHFQPPVNRESPIPISSSAPKATPPFHNIPLVQSLPGQKVPSSDHPSYVHKSSLAPTRNEVDVTSTTTTTSSANASDMAPSVAAVFALAEKSHKSTPVLGGESYFSKFKAPLLDQPPPHSGLLPSPQVPIQGFQRSPLGKVRPPVMPYDFIVELNMLTQSLQLPPPQFTESKKDEEVTGIVSVGQFTYTGAKCSSVEEARQSAAAVAVTRMRAQMQAVHQYMPFASPPWSSPYFPMPFIGMPFPSPVHPHSFGSLRRFPSPGSPYFPVSPLTPSPHHQISPHSNQPTHSPSPSRFSPSYSMRSPVGPTSMVHPRGPKPSLSASATAFIPMQVQRRQTNKPIVSPNTTPSHPPVEEPPFPVTPLRSTGENSSIPIPTETRKLDQSSLATQDAQLFSRLEKATARFEETSAKAAKMSQMLAGIPVVEQIHAPSGQFQTSSNATGIQDPVAMAAIAGALKENVETFIEPVPPSESIEKDIDNICIVGDIVTAEKLL